ncbi:uncharacterized protein V1518DRAFT_417262 [Limtongia smithiae]|uniref:uncharacterized protein n=1 Tax=Limtongia smithiae TaxID=1125753 RepID=UPI0034CE6EFD
MDPRFAPDFAPVLTRRPETAIFASSSASAAPLPLASGMASSFAYSAPHASSSAPHTAAVTSPASSSLPASSLPSPTSPPAAVMTEAASPAAAPAIAATTPATPSEDLESLIPAPSFKRKSAALEYDTGPPYSLSANRPPLQYADLEEIPHGISRQARDLNAYQFPVHRLAEVLQDSAMQPLVVVACGSFSPITYLHLRMFEMAIDTVRETNMFEVVGGYYSPVSDNYRKAGLVPARHRVRMCELACERTSAWLMVDAWESLQPSYQRTAVVLDHFNYEINVRRGGVKTKSGERRPCKIMLLAGGDLIESMGDPNVWADDDLHHILGRYGCLIVERTGSDVRSFLLSHDIMYEHRKNVIVIKQLIYNDISSTKVRLFIRRGMSVQYLLPNSVIRYIEEHGLYLGMSEPVSSVMKF